MPAKTQWERSVGEVPLTPSSASLAALRRHHLTTFSARRPSRLSGARLTPKPRDGDQPDHPHRCLARRVGLVDSSAERARLDPANRRSRVPVRSDLQSCRQAPLAGESAPVGCRLPPADGYLFRAIVVTVWPSWSAWDGGPTRSKTAGDDVSTWPSLADAVGLGGETPA